MLANDRYEARNRATVLGDHNLLSRLRNEIEEFETRRFELGSGDLLRHMTSLVD